MAIEEWGLTEALARVGAAIYTTVAYVVAMLVVTTLAVIYGTLDLLLTAVPMIDGMPVGGSTVKAYEMLGEWVTSNLAWSLSGRGSFRWTAGIVSM